MTNSVYEIRVENLLSLIKEYETQEALQELTGIASSTFSRIKNWNPASPNPNYKRMGEKLARRIENGVGLPMHWMDTQHTRSPSGPARVAPPGRRETAMIERDAGLSSIQRATRDTMVKLMSAGKLPDTVCLKLLQSWQSSVEELELAS